MKKRIYLLAGLLLPLVGMAQEEIEPIFETGVYAFKLSPNGKWIGSHAGDASIYNVETGENIYYSPCLLGLGNAVADNGMAVGDANDVATLMYKGEVIIPETLDAFWFCDINAITRDGKYIAGIVNNTERDGVSYVPFVATVNEDGTVGTPTILPYPKLDFFGAAPQYATAVWMSNDAKVVAGQVQDWRGMFSYPIYYKQDEKGEWSYYLPTESMFNPTGIDIPENPWLKEPLFPEPENFMSGLRRDAYLAAYEAYSMGAGAYPNPEDYMLPDEYDKYADSVKKYNEWYYGAENQIRDYVKIYSEVLQTTASFSGNDMALHPNGDFFVIRGGVENEEGDMVGGLYKFNTSDGSHESLPSTNSGFFPCQILENGTIIVTRGIQNVPTSYILLPGGDRFITLQEYFQESHPEISAWLDAKVPGGTGVVLMNEDMNVITGALVPDQLADYDWDFSDFYYSSYIIKLNESGGVESLLAEPEDGVYTVYNLQGVKLMETKDASQINNLNKGIYIVNGKKIILK